MYVQILCWDDNSKNLYGEEVTLEGELWPGDSGYNEADPYLANKWHDKIYGKTIKEDSSNEN